MDLKRVRSDFPALQRVVDGKPVIYFDNTATSLKPRQVIDAEMRYYMDCPANVHRGLHKLSQEASEEYEGAHSKVGGFVGAGKGELVFTRGTTESINLVMYSLMDSFRPGDEIVVSAMEHHANIVPWQFLERKRGVKLKFVELGEDYSLDLEDLKGKVTGKTKMVSVAHVSNTVGTINGVRAIGEIAHDAKAMFLVDGAQAVPHMKVDVKKLGADFYAFSAHKMCGPTGIGALYGRRELLERMEPFNFGGDMISRVSRHGAEWNELPYKFEAGTPNIAGAFGFAAAVDYVNGLGFDEIHAREKKLFEKALAGLEGVKGIRIHNPRDFAKQAAILLFDHKSIEPHDLALALDEAENIAIRSGMHCAEPLVSSINQKGLDRASFYFYNTEEEVDVFLRALNEIVGAFG